jgi:hypothetical protein
MIPYSRKSLYALLRGDYVEELKTITALGKNGFVGFSQ